MLTKMMSRWLISNRINNIRLCSNLSNAQNESSLDILRTPFRCVENNPLNHNSNHEGKFYQIPTEDYQKLFTFRGLHQPFKNLLKAFHENTIMIRKPVLEIISCFQNTNFDLPVNRYALYGVDGVGKTLSLAHLTHFLSCQPDWLLIHAGWIPKWIRNSRESAPSISRPGRFDLPIDAVIWLQHFKAQNATLLNSKSLTIENTYTWSLREKTEKGKTINDLIEQGISRPKFSSDVAAAILKESKLLAKSGKIKVGVVIDGVNSIFGLSTINGENRKWV
ncbi:hypothetical protein CHUAL_002709 [Chamberlinius hualienensis]